MVGITVLVLFTCLLTTAIWLSAGFDHKKYNMYTVYMHEPINGLSEESVVKFNGVKVGLVDKIQLSPLDPRQVKLTLRIEAGVPITEGSYATLMNQGITGTTYMELEAKRATFSPLTKTPGEPYPVIPSKPSFLNQLQHTINTVSVGFKRMLSEENANNLQESLANLQQFTKTIAHNNSNINHSLAELPKIVDELHTSLNQFAHMADNISIATNELIVTMKTSKAGFNRLSEQLLPPTVLLLHDLDSVASNLEKISNQIKQNPAVIIRGSRPPLPGPGE